MTREEEIFEVAQQYARDLHYMRSRDVYDLHDIIQVARDFAEWADNHPISPWISVEDRLPECKWDERISKNHSHYCVVLQTDGSMYVAQYYCDFEAWSENSYMCEWLRNITHWMPLPELPK